MKTQSAYAPINGYQTTARKTNDVSTPTRNQMMRAMINQAEAMGHASLAGFWADCAMCGERFALDAIELGHVDPAAGTGFAHPANLLPMCRPCNGELGPVDPTEAYVLHYDSRHLWDGILPTDQTNPKKRTSEAIRSKWITK